MSVPIFSYTWNRGGSRAGINPHVIWRIPSISDTNACDEGMNTSQRNIEYLNNNTATYHSRVERTAYMATMVNKNFVSSTSVAQAIIEFITRDLMSTHIVSEDASAAAKYAINCQDTDIIVDKRKLNARQKSNVFDKLWAKMAEMVERRVNDRRHGELL